MFKILSVFCSVICSLTSSLAMVLPLNQDVRYGVDYQSGITNGNTTRTIYYSYADESLYINQYGIPCFYAYVPNSCVIDSAGNALVYYDRLYGNLVPNYSHAYDDWGDFLYGSQNDGVNQMFSDLYVYMGCTSQGTTIPGFKSGMISYAADHGVNMSFTQATGNYHGVDISYIKNQLQQEKLAIIFLDGFSIISGYGLQKYNGYDQFYYNLYSGNHAMLIYGYYDISYYNANGAFIERKTLFKVFTDLAVVIEGYAKGYRGRDTRRAYLYQ